MATIDLTRASIEALEREARNSLDNSVSEAPHGHRIGQEDYAGEHERNLLTCADILGTLRYATLNFPSEAGKVSVEFSAPQIKWLEKTREATRGHRGPRPRRRGCSTPTYPRSGSARRKLPGRPVAGFALSTTKGVALYGCASGGGVAVWDSGCSIPWNKRTKGLGE